MQVLYIYINKYCIRAYLCVS